MRESEYSKTLDTSFKKFLTQKRNAQSSEEACEARAGALLGDNLAEEVREYGCVFIIHLFCN